MLKISALFIYPVKSLGGISLDSAVVTDRGLKHDRRWLLIDENNRFLTQREHASMALLQTSFAENGDLEIRHKKDPTIKLGIPVSIPETEPVKVTIWDDECLALPVGYIPDEWFSNVLGIPCRLVYMPDDTHRLVDPDYAPGKEITSFSDAFPFLLIGQSSLDDLNSRLDQPVPMNRFRPSIVFTGGTPYQEDNMKHFRVGDTDFFGVKPCGRCVVTTINQDEATTSTEPLKTLNSYRKKNNKVLFGQNCIHKGAGNIKVGDEIIIIGDPAF